MDFFEWILDAAAWCLQQEKEWNVRRIIWISVILIAVAFLGYWFYR